MPGMDGLTAARHIAGERRAAVLILTAFSQRELVEQARDAGALAYLVKPFQRSELILDGGDELRALERLHEVGQRGGVARLLDQIPLAERGEDQYGRLPPRAEL